MTDLKLKILYFEYIIHLLLQWHKEIYSNVNPIASFTRLKSLKLLFLVSSVNATQDNNGLLDIFDKFYAMQHGPVESDVYNAMVTSQTHIFDFKERITALKSLDTNAFSQIPEEIKNKIEEAILSLKKRNKFIVTYKSFELVEITHKWESWQIALGIAQILGKGSELMSTESIKNDFKYFS
ncbi:type II toxin-antitoxin system antitoxin SocA domain-containing protein [Bacteroides finegoldii]|uniref:type II toxin-antitoxin system antitoxin SocA domain-containing protein n=1 Tax=Bacteroides finegoldii TaxID=338188 RepID=UPI00234CC33C|nr:type II toxin-antitoxin system antitoxin SocA domain-containing protein [Bacteroides finegoldii]MDC7142398.1 DUF4065 domain-containing protein [Bacteroides finegoldii]